MSILQQARFFTTADAMHQLPNLGLPEVAFAGRSNAGKSTAINTLCEQKRLAFASKTPGRTQHINYFSVGHEPQEGSEPRAFLVDLPGYGYAQVSKSAHEHWEKLLGQYIRNRRELRALILIMDARRPLTDLDCGMIDWFAPTGKPIYALLTKADKLNRTESAKVLRETTVALERLGPLHHVQLFSALKRTGLEPATDAILRYLELGPGSEAGGPSDQAKSSTSV